ncbi:hypothetical protein HG530_014830 [Fusarium avenaceum]|nr:hypothetical protein HG530_014830 [Fusarium avenaceum]
MANYDTIHDLDEVSPPGTPSPALSRSVSITTNGTQGEHVDETGTQPDLPQLKMPSVRVTSESIASEPTLKLPRSSQKWWSRFGNTGLFILVAGTVCILISVSILVFLWAGAGQARRHEHRPQLWNFIIFSGWSISTVTICSAVLRVSLGFQTGIIAAALASVVLETSGVRFSDIAMFSIHRSSYSGPLTILPATLRQCFTNKRTTGHIRGLKGISFWHSPPLAHWRFAEAEPGKPVSVEGVIDTGDVYRATIPFSEETDRASLEYYLGPAMVTNSRTACVGPAFEAVKIDYSPPSNSTPPGLLLRAKFEAHINKILNIGRYKYSSMTVECKLQNDWEGPTSTWPLTMCRVLTEGSEQIFYDFHPRLLVNSSEPLNKVGIVTDWDYHSDDYSEHLDQYRTRFQNLTTEQDGPWTRAFNSNNSEVFQATVCFSRQIPEFLQNVTIVGRAIPSEPDSKGQGTKNNASLITQFGIGSSPGSIEERGILKLIIHDIYGDYLDVGYDPYGFAVVLNSIELGGWSLKIDGVGERTPRLPTNWFLHPEHTALFQTILQQTKNPAKALQELTYRIYQMYFYYRQPSCDIVKQATTVNVVDMQLPDQWTGLIAILALIGLHFIILILAVAIFALRTRSSSLGQAWQSVSHVVSPQTQDIIREAGRDGVKDWHVKWWAESTGLDVGLYSLSRRTCIEEVAISSHQGDTD